MAQIKLRNGTEITLNTREVIELIQEYGSSSPNLPVMETKNLAIPLPSSEKTGMELAREHEIGFPTVDELIESIEKRGRPFSFNVTEDLFQRYGVRPRQDRYHYNKLHTTYNLVKRKMLDRYKGHWVEKKEDINGRPAKRFTLVEDS